MKRKHRNPKLRPLAPFRPPADELTFETPEKARRRIRSSPEGFARVQIAMRQGDARLSAERQREREERST